MSRTKVILTLVISAAIAISGLCWMFTHEACRTPIQNFVAFIAIIIASLIAADAIERKE